MRLQKHAIRDLQSSLALSFLCVAAVLVLASAPIRAGQTTLPPDEMTADANYDEVVRDLVGCLVKDKTTAQDAAVKLARLGRRSIPVLTELLRANFTPEPPPSKDPHDPPPKPVVQKGNLALAYYSTYALAHIRLGEAVKPLLPLLASPRTPPDLRNMVIEAPGLEHLPEAGVLLQKIAAEDLDLAMRKKAYNQLAIMPNFWVASEKLFVTALADPDDEIRALAAKQCMFTRIYASGVDKLIELSEKDAQTAVRTNAMLALSRMRVRKAVPALVRVAVNPETSSALLPTALRTLNLITGVSLKDAAAVQTWWTKFGEAEYAKLEAPPKASENAGPDPASKGSAAPAPEKKDAP